MVFHSGLPRYVRLDPFPAGAQDLRGVDFTPELSAPFYDTISNILSISVISRDDGQQLTPFDLRVLDDPAPYIDISGKVLGWWMTCSPTLYTNQVTVDYLIEGTVLTSANRTLAFAAECLVLPTRG